MEERLRSWWQQIIKHPVVSILIALFIVVGVLVLVGGYKLNWVWTGFNGVKVTYKTLYDWLQLLIIPVVLAVAGYVINLTISRSEQEATKQRAQSEREAAEKLAKTEQDIAQQRYEQDQQIALDKQREDLLQAYLDRMSELLLKEKLRSSEVDAEVRNVARVRTITVLTQLDGRRIGYVFTFLNEAKLMSPTFNDNAVSLGGADFHSINWTQANLSQANLSYANLTYANLTYARLDYANLSLTDLSNANLSRANLYHADISNANLYHVDLSNASLGKANLSETNLAGADLSQANLTIANLSQANLYHADLSDANLSGAIGTTPEQLAKAKSLKGAILPDGSIHP